ncbi:hypothetical protein [Methylibium sp.]|uniref:hypothetical protein n=1 Tax=Methylibium sp. TaxID=2067992 RepID=UPI003D0A8512
MKYRVATRSQLEFGDKIVATYETEMPMAEAKFALELISRFGLIAGEDGGEDSAGRAKGRLMPVELVVTRSFEISMAAFAEARKRGLMLKIPDLDEINAEKDEKIAKEREGAKA